MLSEGRGIPNLVFRSPWSRPILHSDTQLWYGRISCARYGQSDPDTRCALPLLPFVRANRLLRVLNETDYSEIWIRPDSGIFVNELDRTLVYSAGATKSFVSVFKYSSLILRWKKDERMEKRRTRMLERSTSRIFYFSKEMIGW